MNEREKIIRLWFDMWLKQQDLGMDKIFTEDVVYTESWCPKYENLKTVKHWFNEWNTRGKVIIWDIKQLYLHVLFAPVIFTDPWPCIQAACTHRFTDDCIR